MSSDGLSDTDVVAAFRTQVARRWYKTVA